MPRDIGQMSFRCNVQPNYSARIEGPPRAAPFAIPGFPGVAASIRDAVRARIPKDISPRA